MNRAYTITPTTIAHEFGHAIGLRDLYSSTNANKLMYGFENRTPSGPTLLDKWGAWVITGAHYSHTFGFKYCGTYSSVTIISNIVLIAVGLRLCMPLAHTIPITSAQNAARLMEHSPIKGSAVNPNRKALSEKPCFPSPDQSGAGLYSPASKMRFTCSRRRQTTSQATASAMMPQIATHQR